LVTQLIVSGMHWPSPLIVVHILCQDTLNCKRARDSRCQLGSNPDGTWPGFKSAYICRLCGSSIVKKARTSYTYKDLVSCRYLPPPMGRSSFSS
jgi:hypothetical protein